MTVVPEDVSDDAEVSCLKCDGRLRVRDSHERDGTFVARHFWHTSGGEGCSGGESERHRRLKSALLSKVKHFFPCSASGLEQEIGQNIADVYIVFDEPIEPFGIGIVFEVQYRNTAKDIGAATKNYLGYGYSVCWIDDAHMDGQDVSISNPDWFYYYHPYPPPGSELRLYQEFGYEEVHCQECSTPGPGNSPVMDPVRERHAPAYEVLHRCPVCNFELWFGDGYGLQASDSGLELPNIGCFGSPGDRHKPWPVGVTTDDDGDYWWTCWRCEWLKKSVNGEHVDAWLDSETHEPPPG